MKLVKKKLRDILEDWPRNYIQDTDLAEIMGKSDEARYSAVNRAMTSGLLLRMKKGFYLIKSQIKRMLPDEFELAPLLYLPSFVSLESALSYHNWIPEAVRSTTSVSPKRAQEFRTPLERFNYRRVPQKWFYGEVTRTQTRTGIRLVAEPWRALADYMYVTRKSWDNLEQLELDMRIDFFTVMESDIESLKSVVQKYPSPRVRTILKRFLKEILKHLKGAK